MGLTGVAHHPEMHSNIDEAQEYQPDLGVGEKMLPELIQGQIGKLNELDAGVKKALDAAGKAEQRAKSAGERSAGRSLFKDRKKEAIEELQEAGIELAGAVQSGAEAQKLSFELQMRLAEVTKYLFTLGISNIAANRVVVRELEMRLRGASEAELSDLARQEVTSVIRQLKEQEDLLRKQEQMTEALRGHGLKIRHLLAQTDDLGLSVKNQDAQHRALVSTFEAMGQHQQEEISALQHQALAQQTELASITTKFAQASSQAADTTANVLARVEALELSLKEQDIYQRALASTSYSMARTSEQQQQEISSLRKQNLVLTTALAQTTSDAEQSTASLRSALNMRTMLLAGWSISVTVAAYFLR